MKTSKSLVRTWGIIVTLGAVASGCAAGSSTSSETPATAEKGDTESTDSATKVAEKKSPQRAEEKPKGPRLLYTLKDVGLEAPEAIIYDAEEDVYLVSNVNGDPLAEDSNGFISKVGPDGKVQELKWIDGQESGVTLNAPKGMAVSEGFLYVSDITWIRVFDRKTGEPKGKIFAKGATFLNDVTTNEKGEVVFSDTGWKSGKEGYATTGSDAVFRIDPKTVAAKELARSKELGNPNGLAVTKDGLWVVNDQGELFLMGKDGKKEKTTKLAKGGLDGVVALDDGRFLVSSWKAKAIYQGRPGEEFEILLSDLNSPASIGFDSKRGRILVPKMLENQALIYDLSGKAPAAGKAPVSNASAPAAASTGGGATKGEVKAKKQAAQESNAKKGTPEKTVKKGDKKEESATKQGDEKKATAASPKGENAKSKPAHAKSASSATPAEPAKPADPKGAGEPAKPATPATPAQPAKK